MVSPDFGYNGHDSSPLCSPLAPCVRYKSKLPPDSLAHTVLTAVGLGLCGVAVIVLPVLLVVVNGPYRWLFLLGALAGAGGLGWWLLHAYREGAPDRAEERRRRRYPMSFRRWRGGGE